MYSQHGEDNIILEYFGDYVGTLLDIGAYDGIEFSNSRLFMERGWTGTLIEPSPHHFIRLCEHYKDNQKATLIHAAVFDNPGLVDFYEELTFQSTLDTWFREKYKQLNWGHKYKVWPMPASKIKGDFDFVSVDTEGADYRICASMKHILKKCILLCVEHNGSEPDKLWRDLFREVGLSVHEVTKLNYIAVRK